MTNFISHNFNSNSIFQRQEDGYLHATTMCKAAGKHWAGYARLDTTNAYLKALSFDVQIPTSKLIQSKKGGDIKKQGTWIHPKVAIHLAQWLSPEFAVHVTNWVYGWMTDKPQPATLPRQTHRHDAIKRRGVSKTRPAIGERLQDLREAHQITRRELAEMIGVSDSSIWAWENARRTPNQNMIKKLSGVLGVGVKEILTGEVLPPIREVTPAAKFANHDLNGNLQRYMKANIENHAQITKGLREAETMIYELRNKLGEIQGFSAATYSTAQEMRTCARLLTNS